MALTENQRRARKDFVAMYSTYTRDVVRLIARGWDSSRISDKLEIPVKTVATFRANVTRGAYHPFLDGNVVAGFNGVCAY